MKTYSYKDSPLEMHGLPFFSENHIIERVPSEVREKVPSLAFLGRRPAGARLCFRTNSKNLRVKMTLGTLSPDIGMSLFACQSANIYVDGRYLGLARPDNYTQPLAVGKFTKDKAMQDVMIYLPRNEIICDIVVSIDDDARLEAPTPYRHPVPVIFYGSSITEGGCCSRPANAYNALLSRWLDFDYVNLGFSGAGKGELAIADYINTLDKCAFVYDYDHNAPSAEHLAATHEPFFRRIREHSPELPVLMLTKPDADYDPESGRRRDIIRATYEHAVAAGDKRVWFIDGATYYGDTDRDACSADTCHPNDLGMYRMAQTIRPVMEEILALVDR